METNPNINRLLEMLDNPEAYSEQEIRDIINSDDETRRAYQLMVAAKQGYIHKQQEQPMDVESVWQKFSAEHNERTESAENHTTHISLHPSFLKIAAVFLAVAFLGGLAFAAFHFLSPKTEKQLAEVTAPSLTGRAGGESAIRFSNARLDSILTVVSAHYGKAVCFRDSTTCELRLSTMWDCEDSLAVFIETLNEFDGLRLKDEGDTLFVESETEEAD